MAAILEAGDHVLDDEISDPGLQKLWHYGRGRQPFNETNVEFDRQLDHLSVWLEGWNHEQRCKILEGLLVRSNYNQVQFLWTTLQPALHRDFMYSSKQYFPQTKFTPISKHTSREKKQKKMVKKFYRIKSAYIKHRNDVMECNTDLPVPKTVQKEEPIPESILNYKSRWSEVMKNTGKLPTLPKKPPSPKQRSGSPLFVSKSNSTSVLPRSQSLPPLRRHLQDESPRDGKLVYEPVIANPTLLKSMSSIELTRRRKSPCGTAPEYQAPIPVVPDEAWQLYHWYGDCWSDVQRNEFLHKMMRILDSRQLYYISSYLALKQYRDFITLLPEHLALKILHFLQPKELLVVCQVSRTWNRLASSDEIWKAKCDEVEIEVPVTANMKWKNVYKDNIYLKLNWELGHFKEVEVKGHTGKVLSVTFDGRRMASGSKDTTVKVWDAKSGNLLQTLKGHTKGVWCVRFFTRNLLISGSYDCTIKVWNLRKGTCARTLFGHEGAVWAIVRKQNLLASASQDRTAKLWDISRCQLLHTLRGHTQAVFCIDMDDDCTMVLTGSADRSVRIWSTKTGKHTKIIWVSQSTSVMALSLHKGFFACAVGEIISFWRVDTATCVRTFEEHEKRIETLELRISDSDKPEGIIVSAGQDGMIKYWDIAKEKSLHTLKGHNSQVNAISFDETKIISASYDNKCKVWDFNI
ncbi:F-box and WD repeat domain-containing 11-A-like [Ptychodera flava]|uniref:F-box and WD repeat domain-containing 11-A-like n=1 Tax=Ptychodera flava TaxID=63121 RepID=UPI00396A9C38